MDIERIVVGDLEENCYLIIKNNQVLIVDPGDDFYKIQEKVGDKEVLGILVTHHHFDHIGALNEAVNNYNAKVYDFNNSKEQIYNLGPFTFEVIYNPGHSSDSISFYFKDEKKMFVGDFVFLNSIGRCDLEGGNFEEMQQSLNKLKEFKDDIILYPGHGPKTTLNFEKQHNSFF